MIDPSTIRLETPSKKFQYQNMDKHLEKIDDVETLKNILRSYIRMHMRHEELTHDLSKQFKELL